MIFHTAGKSAKSANNFICITNRSCIFCSFFCRLVGIVAFLPGHYTAYCRRSSGHWELLNDMSKSIISRKSSTDIEAHYAVYIRLE